MPKGIYAAASAMVVETRGEEAVARNLANVETAGYRCEVARRTSFAETMAQRGAQGDISGDGGAGVLDAGSYHVFTEGPRETTGAPLDMALSGDGFYRVTDQHGHKLLTRAAHFSTDTQGHLITPQGWQVEGQGGPITIPPDANRITVSKNGTISVQTTINGIATQTVLDQLRIVNVPDPQHMQAISGQYFDPGTQTQTDTTKAVVQQGYLERANVEPMQQLALMIAGQRRFDAAQRALREQDKSASSLVDLLRGST